MKLYIAGPITGHDLSERVAYFREQCKVLVDLGHEAVNPFDLHPIGLPWEEALKRDLTILLTCDGIYILPGWERSRGARLELHVALALGLKIFFKEDQTLVSRQ